MKKFIFDLISKDSDLILSIKSSENISELSNLFETKMKIQKEINFFENKDNIFFSDSKFQNEKIIDSKKNQLKIIYDLIEKKK